MTALLLLMAWGHAHRPRRVRRATGWRLAGWVARSIAGLAVAALAFEHGGYRAVDDYFTRGVHVPDFGPLQPLHLPPPRSAGWGPSC